MNGGQRIKELTNLFDWSVQFIEKNLSPVLLHRLSNSSFASIPLHIIPSPITLHLIATMTSSDLQWELLRQTNNRFLLKRSGLTFSTEPGNLLNLHSKKYSGLVNEKAIHVGFPTKDTASVAVSYKTKRSHYSKPSEFSVKKGYKGSHAAVDKYAKDTLYRVDLACATKARISAVIRAQKPKKERKQKMRANKLARLTRNPSA